MAADRETAVEQAIAALRGMPRDPARYDMEVTETADALEVHFTGKSPRPPGDEVTVSIDKRSGALRIVQGE